MPKTRQQKQDSVASLSDKLAKAKSVFFADFKGLTMSQLSSLRTKLREQTAEFSVTKNSLLKLALQATNLKAPLDDLLKGPTASLFSFDDEINPLKSLTKVIKDSGIGEVKGGFLAGEFLAADKVKQLSALPGKDELRGKVVGTLGAPLYGIVGVLQANLRNLVYALDQIRISRGGDTQTSS